MARKVEPKQNNDPKKFSLIADAKLRQLYAAMLQCRLMDESLRQTTAGAKRKRLSSIGHEAALVGAALDLRREDWLLPQHRTAVASLLRGEPLSGILSKPQTGRLEPSQPMAEAPIPPFRNIVPPAGSLGAQLNIAVGLALAAQSRQKGQIVLAFCEADAGAPTEIAEALRFAALRQLPLILLALPPNSRTAKAGAASKKGRPRSLVAESQASGIPVIPVDHADIVAMYRVAFESIHKARHNAGPTLIAAAIWPFPGSADPLAKMEAYLVAKRLFSDRWKQSVVERCKAEGAILQGLPR